MQIELVAKNGSRIRVVQDSLVRNGNAEDVFKHISSCSGTEAIRDIESQNKAKGI